MARTYHPSHPQHPDNIAKREEAMKYPVTSEDAFKVPIKPEPQWSEKNKDLGRILVNSEHKLAYTFIGKGVVDPSSIITSCGCSVASWNKRSKTIELTYTAQPIPKHLKEDLSQNFQHILKEVYADTIEPDGTRKQHTLTFQAEVRETL